MSLKIQKTVQEYVGTTYVDSLGSFWKEVCTKLVMCGSGVIQLAAGEVRLD